MSSYDIHPPELVPILSRGKHRNPRKGACFMEMASYLAGERWSDHPACTHPLLGAVARHVNDRTTDAGRQRLVELIPTVIGLTSNDLHVDAAIALRCATTALPVVAAERQRIMAAAVLGAMRVLADLDGRPSDAVEERGRSALAQVPQAARWARDFTFEIRTSPVVFRRVSAPTIAHYAVEGIAQACVPDPDDLLRALLIGTIADVRAWVQHDDPVAVPAPSLVVSAAR
jgi:hypothetical protein